MEICKKENIVIGDLKVMKSAAGYYLGHGYYDPEFFAEKAQKPLEQVTEEDCGLPYSRESFYFGTKEEASHVLDFYLRRDKYEL